jgi:hypothetical protein
VSAGFYERFLRGEKPAAGWVNETDFEQEPIEQEPIRLKP